jgi:hypothetical protein
MKDVQGRARAGDWLQTYSGKQFWPLDPRVEEIDIGDIASALSKTCRFGGHCLHFYSVAEHCVLLVRWVRANLAAFPEFSDLRLQLELLLHDATEGYLPDLIRPLKRHFPDFVERENTLHVCIAKKFGINYPMHASIKALDTCILFDEMAQNMAPPPKPWTHGAPGADHPLGITLQFWKPADAYTEFMCEFIRCGGRA